MSPTSYQTAPPRSNVRTLAVPLQSVKRARPRVCRCVGRWPRLFSAARVGRRQGHANERVLEEDVVKPFRLLVWAVLVMSLAWMAAPPAEAAPEVHKLNLVISANPTQLVAKDLNDFIDDYNRTVLNPKGLESLGNISFAWYYQAEVRYFLRQNWALSAGFGQIQSTTRREFLPRIAQVITVRSNVVSVPVHLGATYYLAPFTQGDFQARAYLGGGFMSLTNNKIVFEQLEFQTDSATTLGGSARSRGRRDGPGYYFEVGGHMFFASRYSLMIGAIYRSATVRNLRRVDDVVEHNGNETVTQIHHDEPTIGLDSGGLGLRMGLGIGF